MGSTAAARRGAARRVGGVLPAGRRQPRRAARAVPDRRAALVIPG